MGKIKNTNSFEHISQIIRAHRKSSVLFSAFELGVMDKICVTFKTAQEISDELNLPVDGLKRLLSVLCAFKILEKNKDMYRLRDGYHKLFDPTSDDYIGGLIRHEIHLQKRWLKLSESIKSGLPIKKTNEICPTEDTQRFINAMANIGQRTAPIILDRIRFKGNEHVLDLGGGPGKYMKQLCEKYPKMQVTLFEKPETIKAAKQLLKNHKLLNHMYFKNGDIFEDDFGKEYDVIFISNVIHIYGFDGIHTMLNKCYQALNPSGRILVKDYFLEKNKTGPEFAAIFSLHMFLSTDHGGCCSESEFYDLMKQAGFKKGKKTTLTKSSLVLEGIK